MDRFLLFKLRIPLGFLEVGICWVDGVLEVQRVGELLDVELALKLALGLAG